MKAYKAYVNASKNCLLLGGTRCHESTPFKTKRQANNWIYTVVKTNCEAGRSVSDRGWTIVDYPNPILEED